MLFSEQQKTSYQSPFEADQDNIRIMNEENFEFKLLQLTAQTEIQRETTINTMKSVINESNDTNAQHESKQDHISDNFRSMNEQNFESEV